MVQVKEDVFVYYTKGCSAIWMKYSFNDSGKMIGERKANLNWAVDMARLCSFKDKFVFLGGGHPKQIGDEYDT